MKENKCPECGKLTDSATDMQGNAQPSGGDLSICIGCGTINLFDDDLTIIPMPTDIWLGIKKDDPETYSMVMDAVISIKANNVR